jgi:hypothetical protein
MVGLVTAVAAVGLVAAIGAVTAVGAQQCGIADPAASTSAPYAGTDTFGPKSATTPAHIPAALVPPAA